MTKYILIHFESHLPVLEGFWSLKSFTEGGEKHFLYLLDGVPFGLAWKLPFQPNL